MSRGSETGSPSEALQDKPTLRLITCGSVDDGKSTLIGRLLFEQALVPDDDIAALHRDTELHGSAGGAIDYALLVDGLEAERQQGITIDVAYRYVRTKRRSLIIADTPGHEQYTRNMATGASNADLAILLVDARKGLLTQTRRHAVIAALLGIRQVVLAVNKIDLVDFRREVFLNISSAFRRFAVPLEFAEIMTIPLSARHGDNLSTLSPRTPWYEGPSLLERLETVDVADDGAFQAFRMPVQWINRPDPDFRGLTGTVVSGRIALGDTVMVANSGRCSTVKRILVSGAEAANAESGDAVTLTLAQEIDVTRGDVLATPAARPTVANTFEAIIIWMDDEPLELRRRSYLLKLATRTVPASVAALAHRLDVDRYAPEPAAGTLRLNEVGRVTLAAAAPLAFDCYAANRATGAFILIDRETNRTVAAGTVLAAARGDGSRLVHRPVPADRARMKNQRACVVWLAGPAAEEVALEVDARLHGRGLHTALLLESELAQGLNREVRRRYRVEAIRRLAEAARLVRDAGLVVICAIPAAADEDREAMRAVLAGDALHEISVGPVAPAGNSPAFAGDEREIEQVVEIALRHLAGAPGSSG